MGEEDNKLLALAALANDLELVRQRLPLADDINFQLTCNGSALHQAVRHGNVEMAALLIAAGADVNRPCRHSGLNSIDLVRHGSQGAMIDLLRWNRAVASDPARDSFLFRMPSPCPEAEMLRIEALPELTERFLSHYQTYCVPECCGLGATPSLLERCGQPR
jgi:hypothetical protein